MKQYIRSYELTIGQAGGSGFVITDNDIEFTIGEPDGVAIIVAG